MTLRNLASRERFPSAAAAVMDAADGYVRARLIHAAARLGIPDAIDGRPRTASEVARRIRGDPDALTRLLRGLLGIGLVRAAGRRRYAATPFSDCLRTDAPGSIRTLVVFSGAEWHWRAWGEIDHAVRTGRTGFERAFGTQFFRHLDRTPKSGALFDAGMAIHSAHSADLLLRTYGFRDVRTIVDVGGGRGGLLLPLLKRHAHLRGVILDRPRALRAAAAEAKALGVGERCRTVAGDFFRSVPRGGDVYLLRNTLHDWDDARALRILRNCRRAMADNAQLLILEAVPPPGNGPWAGAITDLSMLMLTSGRERTRAEHRALCRAAGLRVRRFDDASSGATIVEVVRAR